MLPSWILTVQRLALVWALSEWETTVGMPWQAGPALPIADVLILHFNFYPGRGEASGEPHDCLAQGPQGQINWYKQYNGGFVLWKWAAADRGLPG